MQCNKMQLNNLLFSMIVMMHLSIYTTTEQTYSTQQAQYKVESDDGDIGLESDDGDMESDEDMQFIKAMEARFRVKYPGVSSIDDKILYYRTILNTIDKMTSTEQYTHLKMIISRKLLQLYEQKSKEVFSSIKQMLSSILDGQIDIPVEYKDKTNQTRTLMFNIRNIQTWMNKPYAIEGIDTYSEA